MLLVVPVLCVPEKKIRMPGLSEEASIRKVAGCYSLDLSIPTRNLAVTSPHESCTCLGVPAAATAGDGRMSNAQGVPGDSSNKRTAVVESPPYPRKRLSRCSRAGLRCAAPADRPLPPLRSTSSVDQISVPLLSVFCTLSPFLLSPRFRPTVLFFSSQFDPRTRGRSCWKPAGFSERWAHSVAREGFLAPCTRCIS